MKRIFLSALCTLLLLGGCGGNKSTNNTTPPPTVSVSVSPSSASVSTGGTQQFMATVTGTSNTAVTWTVSGPGCSGASCGTINSTGLYSAPDAPPAPNTITVTATSQADNSKSAGANVTINASVSVSVSPSSVSVSIGGTQQFTATVTGTSNTAVTWAVSGAGCSGDTCGTVSSTGLYSAPDAPPTPNTITVTATSQADNSKSAAANVTTNTSTNSKLTGSYAFLFSGYETSGGAPVAIAGSISLDGQGGVSGGQADINRASGISLAAHIGSDSTYLLGADNRGRLVLNVGTTPPLQLNFRIAMDGQTPSRSGRLIAFDAANTPSGLLGSGVIERQDNASFSTAAFNGDFALGLSGILGNPTADRAGAVGRFHLDGAGGVSSGVMDFNLGGNVYSSLAATGMYSIAPDGRGTATLNVAAPVNQLHFSFYVVSTTEAVIVESDARGATTADLSGSVLAQSGQPFSNSSLRAGGAAIFNLTGQTGGGSVVSLGRIVTNGAGQVTDGTLDQNSSGTILTNVPLTGSYAVVSNGRGTLTLTFSTAETFVIYMVKGDTGGMMDQRSAFLLQTTQGSAEVGTGFLEAQSSSPTITTASITGTFRAGTLSPAACGCAGVSGVANFDGAGNFAGVRDRREPSGDSRVFPHENWLGTYSVPGSTGRGTLQIVAPSSEHAVIYAMSPSKFMMVIVEETVTAPVVTVFEK